MDAYVIECTKLSIILKLSLWFFLKMGYFGKKKKNSINYTNVIRFIISFILKKN